MPGNPRLEINFDPTAVPAPSWAQQDAVTFPATRGCAGHAGDLGLWPVPAPQEMT